MIKDTKPYFEKNLGLNYSETMNPEQKVNYLVQNTRLVLNSFIGFSSVTNSKCLDTKWTPFKKNKYDIENDVLINEGMSIAELLIRIHYDKKGMEFKQADISSLSSFIPEEQIELKRKLKDNKHSFVIAIIDGKKYIIDCAYRQFFEESDNTIKNEIINLREKMTSDKQINLVQQLLKYGWIEGTPENLKMYLDGFIQAASKNAEVQTPTEKEYEENFRGKTIDDGRKTIHKYELKNLWKVLYEKFNIRMSNELSKYISNHRNVLKRVKTNLQWSEEKFYIITQGTKKYINTKDGEIEFTLENLKRYLDKVLVENIKKEDFLKLPVKDEEIEEMVLPSINDYLSIYSCAKPISPFHSFIIESEPYIWDEAETNDDFNIQMTDEEKINSIVQRERRHLIRHFDITNASLTGECEDSTVRVLFDSISKGCEDARWITPAKYLINGSAGHNATIVRLNGKSYLIDCTYRQFFEEKNSSQCGIYMLNNKTREKVAKQLLKYGWIEATPENIKAYMDGFEMGQRKSLEETGISPEEYIRRLAENEKCPIHIISTSEISMAGIESEITIDDVTNPIDELFKNLLENSKEI